MQLEINNVAKIKKATINVDGITVIAGENNTGKSTIGKLLFAIFNSMNDMENKVENERYGEIYRIISRLLQHYVMQNGMWQGEDRRKNNIFSKKLSEKIMKNLRGDAQKDIDKNVNDFIMEEGLFKEERDIEDFISECSSKLKTIVNISDRKIMTEVITRWFNTVFENQISPLSDKDMESGINLTIKNKKLEYRFKENMCIDWNSEFNILNQAFYIDNPFVVDYMSERITTDVSTYCSMKMTDMHLLRHLCKKVVNRFS